MTRRRHRGGRDYVLNGTPSLERPCQLLDDVVAPLLVKPGKAAKEDNEYMRQGTGVLAYDLDKGIRYTQTRKQRTEAEYAEFMSQIVTTYYADVEQIDLVQDNLNTHKYGSFYEHLPLAQARSLSQKLVFHYTPKHGSWLNRAEPSGRSHRIFGLSPAVSYWANR